MKLCPALKLLFVTGFVALVSPCHAEVKIDRAWVDQTMKLYSRAWVEPAADLRTKLLAQAWAKDGRYRDPGVDLKGVDALAQHMGEFITRFPKAQIVATSKLDTFGAVYRVAWVLHFNDGATPDLEGFDCGELDAEGRLVSLLSFFGPLSKE